MTPTERLEVARCLLWLARKTNDATRIRACYERLIVEREAQLPAWLRPTVSLGY